MKVERLDHVHIYVRDLGAAISFFSKVLGTKFSKPVLMERYHTRWAVCPLGILLIAPTGPEGPVVRALERRGEGIANIALKVSDIEAAKAELQRLGLRMVDAFRNKGAVEAHFDPRDAHGVMIEILQYDDVHGVYTACGPD